MKHETMKILFVIKKSSLLKNGEAPIVVRVTINGVSDEVRIQRSVLPRLWNQARGCCKGRDRVSIELNDYIESLKTKIHNLHKELLLEDALITPSHLLKRLFNKGDKRTFLNTMEKEIKAMEALIGIEYEKITINRYWNCYRCLKACVQSFYEKEDIVFPELSRDFIIYVERHMRLEKRLCQNTLVRYMKCFKKFVNMGLNMGWMRINPFAGIQYRQQENDPTFLTLEEVKTIAGMEFPVARLNIVRDMFLFSCFTGLAFIDAKELKRTKHILAVFRRLKYKILDTGTTTRNKIAELYSQFELLYNNSVNMTCWCDSIYHENRDKEIECERNLHCGEPFPAFRGHVLFRACHCPGKATVFGIEKQNQDVYNKDELFDLIGKTIITRKFRDFAGEKYKIRTHTVSPSKGEHEVYRVIIEEFCRICELYYNSTGDTKKDAGLRLMRQIKLLIKACSVPHLISGYYGDDYPSKTRYIESLIRKIPGKVAIGCTTLAAFDLYESYIRERFPDRPIYVVKGDVAFKKRQSIVTEFDSTINGILICTQQSLSSSVNIPTCNDVILESLQWNIPKMEQFYFRFIRLDSKEMKDVHYVTYEDSVEQNLMALVLTKERLNEFIKTGEVKEQSEIFEEFDITMSVIDSLLIRSTDSEGKIHISWGSQRVTS